MNFALSDILAKEGMPRAGRVDDVALVFKGRCWTYGELDHRIGRLAAGLLDAGFKHGDAAAVISHNRPEWIDIFFALARIGGVIVPVNFFLKPAEIEFILNDSHATWVFCEDQFWDTMEPNRAASDRTYVALGKSTGRLGYQNLLSDSAAPTQPDVRPDDLFTLLYTSGTTGQPKGAMHSQATVLWNSFHQIQDFQVTHEDVWLVVSSLCWGAGFHDLTLGTWWAGGKVVLKESTGFEPKQFSDLIAKEGVTKCLLVPSALRRIVEFAAHGGLDLSSLKLILCGGESVPVALLEQANEQFPGCKITQVYGLSEFPSLMLYLDPGDAATRIGSAGKPAGIAVVRVVNSSGHDVSGDDVGEIICRSPAVMLGYLGLPDASAVTLKDRWLHTGDLARVDADGYVYIVGRAKDMYISGGLNVYPAEVERAILACPSVSETAVLGVAEEKWGEVGHAIVVLAPGCSLEEVELRNHLKLQLANYKLPRSVDIRRDPLPRTASGKIRKAELRLELAAKLNRRRPKSVVEVREPEATGVPPSADTQVDAAPRSR
jgi:fatty-acyl-CoA synthase